MCIDNMNNKASELGCEAGDKRCLCDSENYSFGVRDCTKQACPDDDSENVVQIALSSCPKDSMFLFWLNSTSMMHANLFSYCWLSG